MDDSLWSNLDPAEPVVHEAAQSKRPVSDEDAPRQQPMKAGLKPAQRKAPTADQKKHRRQMSKSSGWSDDPEVQAWHKARENVTYTDGSRVQEGDRIRFHQAPGGLLPPGDWRYGEAAYMPGSESKELLLKDDNDGRYYNLYSHVIERAPKKESSMSTQRTEEELLARLATASTMVEQAAIAAQIEDLRATTREHVSVAGSLDWDAMDSSGTALSHLPSADAHTAAAIAGEHLPAYSVTHDSDWLDDVLPTHVADAQMSATMRAQATGWYTEGVWEPVKADADEFSVQAHNAAVRSSALFGLQRQAAASVFLAQVDHLRTRDGQPKVTRTAEWGTDPYDAPQGDTTNPTYVSDGRDGLPVGVDPSTAETFDEDTLGSGSTSSDPKSSGDTGAAQSLDEGSTPEGDKAVSSENPLTGDTSLDKSTYDTGEPTDRMKTQGAKGVDSSPNNPCMICGKTEWHTHSLKDWQDAAKKEAKSPSAHTGAENGMANYAACPNHPGQSYNTSTGDCSCGSNHKRWANSNNPGGQKSSARTAAGDLSDEDLQSLVAEQHKRSQEWDKAFADLKAARVPHDADHPVAKRYRDASDAVNHLNRKLDYYVATGRVHGDPYTVRTSTKHTAQQCPNCGGTGAVPESGGEDPKDVDNGYKQCPTCHGTGEVGDSTKSSSLRTTADLVGDVMRYEQGDMDEDETVAFFQRLIDDGTVWHLQGSYGRMAQSLIDAGLCHPAQTEAAKQAASENLFDRVASFFGDTGIVTHSQQVEADNSPDSTDGLGTGIDEGETPEGDHAESATQNTPSGDLDKSSPTDSDNLPTGGSGGGTGVNWGEGDTNAATSTEMAYTSALEGLSDNARTFVATLARMGSLDDVVAGVSGHRVAELLAADPTCPEQVREALRGGGNPFVREAGSSYSEEDKRKIMGPKGHEISAEQARDILTKAVAGGYNARVYGLAHNQIVTLATPDALDKFSGSLELIWQSKAGVEDLVSKGAKSDTCPRCGSHMSDVTVHGDTLRAKCSNCGWSGTKKKSSLNTQAASDTGTCATCGRWISYDKDSRKWSHDDGEDDHEAKPARSAAHHEAEGSNSKEWQYGLGEAISYGVSGTHSSIHDQYKDHPEYQKGYAVGVEHAKEQGLPHAKTAAGQTVDLKDLKSGDTVQTADGQTYQVVSDPQQYDDYAGGTQWSAPVTRPGSMDGYWISEDSGPFTKVSIRHEAARDTGNCAACGRAISYDKDSRKWTHDDGEDYGHAVKPNRSAALSPLHELAKSSGLSLDLSSLAANLSTVAESKPPVIAEPDKDLSGGWARQENGRPEYWGNYQHGDTGQVIHVYRGKGNKVRFYGEDGKQVGPEQSNVAPAAAWALTNGYHNPDLAGL